MKKTAVVTPLPGYTPCLVAAAGTNENRGRPGKTLVAKADGIKKFWSPLYHICWAVEIGPPSSDRGPASAGVDTNAIYSERGEPVCSPQITDKKPKRLRQESKLPVIDEETPAVTHQKAEEKASQKERKSKMKALLKAGGEPEMKNDSDRKLWERMKAKEEPVGNGDKEEEEKEEFMGFGDDDSGFAEYDFNCPDDGVFEPEKLTDDLQAQTQSIASELDDGVMRPFGERRDHDR
ncbi:hypothetical protein LTR97_012107 [Elasticomyces elasticus]|uniref:Uncharacterized protein n=1 Tax=Elasticomyces elasticus TaxID=574655 RepID=A0AAN7W0L7_9PEZI|nr:hypothetical protein LTR97_012107 [Elasticomyces elasticus]